MCIYLMREEINCNYGCPTTKSDTTRERAGKGKLGREREYRVGRREKLGREYFEEKRYLVRERKNAADDLQFR